MKDFFAEIYHNKYLWLPLLTWFFIQAFKVIWDLVETKKFNFKRILGAGGMPSSHSAVVTGFTLHSIPCSAKISFVKSYHVVNPSFVALYTP